MKIKSTLATAGFAPLATTLLQPVFAAPMASSAATANDGTERMMLTKQQIVEVRHALISKADAIKADGIWGSKSTRTMKDFQETNGLGLTGYIDKASLTALRILSRA